MDLQRLKMFREVVDQRSYSQAARRLGLTQSAVSQQMSRLERDVGVQLFDTQRRAQPTPAGECLYAEAAKLLAAMDDALGRVRQVGRSGAGHVRFGMIDVAATELMPRVLTAFRKKYPQVHLEAVVKPSGDLISLVEQRQLEFAVVVDYRLPPELSATSLFSDSIIALAHPASAIARRRRIRISDLENVPLILYPRGAQTRLLIDEAFAEQGVVPQVAMELHYPAAMLSLVQQRMGVALLSQLSAEEVTHHLTTLSIVELKRARHIAAVTHAERDLAPQARTLIALAARMLRKRS